MTMSVISKDALVYNGTTYVRANLVNEEESDKEISSTDTSVETTINHNKYNTT